MHPSQFALLQRARTVNASLTKTGGHHVAPDGKLYVDTAFINAAGRLPGCSLEHMGFGEFSLKTPKGEVEFDRMRGKAFDGMSGRSHQFYDTNGGQKAAEWVVEEMEKKNLSTKTASGMEKEAGVALWKYTDEEKGKDFYLKSRKTTVKSPWTGKAFTTKPIKATVGDVGKELKEEGAKVKGALWKYVDDDGNEFYLESRLTATLKSPWTGKAFTPKPEKDALTEVSKEIREEQKAGKGTGGGDKAAMPKMRGKKKASDDAAWKAESPASTNEAK